VPYGEEQASLNGTSISLSTRESKRKTSVNPGKIDGPMEEGRQKTQNGAEKEKRKRRTPLAQDEKTSKKKSMLRFQKANKD